MTSQLHPVRQCAPMSRMALPWVFLLVIGAARAQSSLKFELPGLPYQTELTALGNDKVEEICNLIGLCLPLKGASPPPPPTPASPPPALPAVPPATPPATPPSVPGLAPTPIPAPAPVPAPTAPAPAPASCASNQILLAWGCATMCNFSDNPYIGKNCPSGSICTLPADPETAAEIQPSEGILAVVGQAELLLSPVNCTTNGDCSPIQFCAATSDITAICLDTLGPVGKACYAGGAADERSGAGPAPSPL